MSVLTVFKSMISGVLTFVFVALQRVPPLTRHPARSDYAKFDEIVQMSYLYTHPRVQEWSSLQTWQTRDNYADE
jgi:hypothetical protein